jgi:hypothetical protein
MWTIWINKYKRYFNKIVRNNKTKIKYIWEYQWFFTDMLIYFCKRINGILNRFIKGYDIFLWIMLRAKKMWVMWEND